MVCKSLPMLYIQLQFDFTQWIKDMNEYLHEKIPYDVNV